MNRVTRKSIGLAAAFLLLSLRASAQFCSNCIYNSAAPQNAQMNIGTATIRGTLTVNQLVAAALNISSMTAGLFFGDGSHLTILNATQLSSGTVPSARLAGSYTGITGVGTLAAGTWNGSVVGTQYGGTGQNFVTASTGMLPYFSNVGVMSTLAPASAGVLMTQGATLPPAWTTSPAITGANVTAIPLSHLNAGNLPTNIVVNDVNITTVAASKVIGNISGGAATLTIPLPIGNLAGGTLPTSNAASSVTAIVGLQPGTFGGPNNMAQFHVNYDGRISTAAQFNLVVYSTQIAPGPLPPTVTIAASQITSGTLANNVIASSVGANGVAAGTYGGPTVVPQLTVTADGRVTTIAQFAIAGVSTTTAFVDVDNNWRHAQTSQSSWTFKNVAIGVTGPNGYVLGQSSISTSGGFFGNGSALTGIPSTGSIVGVYLPLAGGTMTGQLVVANLSAPTDVSSFTVTGANGIKTPNLLIGAGTSAGANLDVEGSAQFGSGVAKSTFAASGELTFPNNVGISGVNSGGNPFSMVRFTNGDTLRIQTDSPGNKVTIGGNPGITATFVNGTVGISTGLPQATLDVNGNTLVRGNIVLTSSITLSAGQQVLVGSNLNCGTTPGLCVDELTSGNVAFFRNGNGAQLRLLNGTAPDVGIYMAAQDNTSTNNSLNINFSGTHLLTVANDGKVGIGVLGNAATLLDVTGNAQFGSGVSKSTISATGAFTLASGAALTLSGSAGTIVSGSSITGGAFYGNGANLSGVTASAVAAANVQAGTLGPAVIASSVAATGVTAATYGSATQAPQIVVAGDGRITSASNVTVTPAAGSITSGTLGAAVIASSVAATAVTAGSYGSASAVGTFTVGGDGRLTAASNTSIAIAESAVTNLVTDLAAKASTGTDNSITRLQLLRTIDLGITASSVTATNGVLIPAGKQLIVGTNATLGSVAAIVADEAAAGPVVAFRNANTGGIVRILNTTSSVEQGILIDAGNDSSDGNSSLRIRNASAANYFWVGNGGKIGMGTETPATILDVAGNAQFGSGATKSTFTATGQLQVGGTGNSSFYGSTTTISPSGILTFGSQTGAKVFFQDAQVVPMDVWTQQFLANTTANGTGFNNQNMYIATSSGSLVARGAGVYSGECAIGFSRQLETQWIEVTRNGAPGVGDTIAHGQFWSQNTSVVYHPIPWSAKLADGDLIQCWVFIDGGVGNETMNGNQRTYLSAKKDQ